jgi:hypothetical protein
MKTPEEFAEAMRERGVVAPRRPEGDFVVTAHREKRSINVWWSEIDTLARAIAASDLAFGVAMFVMVVNAIAATVSLVAHTTILGISPYAYIDAGMFGIIGCGIRRRSRSAAVVGLMLFLFEKVYQFVTLPATLAGLGMAVFITTALVGGVRGNFAYQRFVPDGYREDAKSFTVGGVDLRRPLEVWVTALLCVIILYKLLVGWVGGNLLWFALKAAVLVFTAVTFFAIFQRPSWGRAVAGVFSLLIALLMFSIAALTHALTARAEAEVWVVLGAPALLYVYAMWLGRPVRDYFTAASTRARTSMP